MNRQHPATPPNSLTRRNLLKAGTIGAMSMADVAAWRCASVEAGEKLSPPKSVIYIFLTGGPSQHDTFDMKPEGPVDYRGEFTPVATKTPGIQICEHLPRLAERSRMWSLVRSLTHKESGHGKGTYVMLTGHSAVPPTFRDNRPQPTDLPSIAAIAGHSTERRSHLPSSAILPEKLHHSNSGTFSGQFAGLLGPQHEPWLIHCTDKPHAYHDYSGAFPKYLFNLHDGVASDKDDWKFEVPNLALPTGVANQRFLDRLALLNTIDAQHKQLDRTRNVARYQRIQESVVSLMNDRKVRQAFDVRNADPKVRQRYGDNSFGWSLLMARRLVETGVNMVQVNLGNFGSWDLHGNNFPLLKNFLFPPTDRAVSALLDDLAESGMLDSTMVVMAGEFGRTPRIFNGAPNVYKLPGRDHWAPCQSVLFAGGGVRGGSVIGSSDKSGAYPTSDAQTPESFAATIYHALGIPRTASWQDATGRPYHIYQADPIAGLFA